MDEYHRLGQASILPEEERVELIDGEIVQMTPIEESHASIVDYLANAITRSVLARYRSQHPGPDDTLLLIEVSDSTFAYDRGVKLEFYARSGIRDVWIVDVKPQLIEQFTEPMDGIYHQSRIFDRNTTANSASVPELTLQVAAIFG